MDIQTSTPSTTQINEAIKSERAQNLMDQVARKCTKRMVKHQIFYSESKTKSLAALVDEWRRSELHGWVGGSKMTVLRENADAVENSDEEVGLPDEGMKEVEGTNKEVEVIVEVEVEDEQVNDSGKVVKTDSDNDEVVKMDSDNDEVVKMDSNSDKVVKTDSSSEEHVKMDSEGEAINVEAGTLGVGASGGVETTVDGVILV